MMKNRKYILAVALLALLSVTEVSAQVNFLKGTLEEALKVAKEQNKNLFVDFYTDWCNPCKKIDAEVFSRKDVGDYFNQNLIALKLNAEAEQNKAAVQKYKIAVFPQMLILDAKGNELKRIKGAVSTEMLMKDVRVAIGEDVTYEQLYEKYKKNKKDYEIQQQLLIEAPMFIQGIDGYERDKWSVRIETLFEDYVKSRGLKNMISEVDLAIIRTFHGETSKDDQILEHLIKNFDEYCKVANRQDVSEYIIGLNNSYIIQMCKRGNMEYKNRLQRIEGDMQNIYSGVSFGKLTVGEAVSLLANGTFYLYKQKDNKQYFETMDKYLKGLDTDVTVNDYSSALEDLYVAYQGVLPEECYTKSIEWIGMALELSMSESVRVKMLVMLSDCYVGLSNRDKAKQSLNQAFLVTARLTNPDEKAYLQSTIKEKLQTL